MKRLQKIVEIILSEFLTMENLEFKEEKIFLSLIEKGFKKEEIVKALELISNKISCGEEKTQKENIPLRVFTEIERIKMEEETQNFLLSLYYSKAISLFQLEEILHRIVTNEKFVDKKTLYKIIDDVLGFNLQKPVEKILIN